MTFWKTGSFVKGLAKPHKDCKHNWEAGGGAVGGPTWYICTICHGYKEERWTQAKD